MQPLIRLVVMAALTTAFIGARTCWYVSVQKQEQWDAQQIELREAEARQEKEAREAEQAQAMKLEAQLRKAVQGVREEQKDDATRQAQIREAQRKLESLEAAKAAEDQKAQTEELLAAQRARRTGPGDITNRRRWTQQEQRNHHRRL